MSGRSIASQELWQTIHSGRERRCVRFELLSPEGPGHQPFGVTPIRPGESGETKG